MEKRIKSNKLIAKAKNNINSIKSESYDLAPEEIEDKSWDSNVFTIKYDIYRLKNVRKDADRHLRSDANRDIKKKEVWKSIWNWGAGSRFGQNTKRKFFLSKRKLHLRVAIKAQLKGNYFITRISSLWQEREAKEADTSSSIGSQKKTVT